MRKLRAISTLWLFGLLVWCVQTAPGQPYYSIDFQGPSNGLPDGFPSVFFINEGHVLTHIPPGIPPPAPGILMTAQAPGLGLLQPPLHPFVEVDALSLGLEPQLGNTLVVHLYAISVDEFAVGLPGLPVPSIGSEGAAGSQEASADICTTLMLPPGPVGPNPPGSHVGAFDGNGTPPFGGPGLNLAEPNPQGLGVPDVGDTIDALEMEGPVMHPVYFSLDSHHTEPLEGAPVNTGTAQANGFVGGDVLVTLAPGQAPILYAAAAQLGLDANGTAPDFDDVDALAVWDDGDQVYQPTTGPYSWLAGTDMVLYSVRRGSAVVGLFDVLQSLPIEEGDVLVPVFDPVDGMPLFDGVEGDWDPGIFVAAEALGLATVRSFTGAANGVINPVYGIDIWADDLDALDVNSQVDPTIFTDDFESGDTSAWSATVP
jgi:hypothetical protein